MGLEILTALETDVLLDGDEGDRCLGDGVEEADGFAEGSAEAGQFADDKAVARFERAHELVETPALGVGTRRRGSLDELVDSEALPPGVLEDGEALAAGILLAGGDAQVGDGFHRAVDEIMVPVLNLTCHDTGNASRSVGHSWLAETGVCS